MGERRQRDLPGLGEVLVQEPETASGHRRAPAGILTVISWGPGGGVHEQPGSLFLRLGLGDEA